MHVKKRKIVSTILTLVMMVGLLYAMPMTASAETHNVNNAAGFARAITDSADGDTIRLGADIRYEGGIEIRNKGITIDLNSHLLTVNNSTGDAACGLRVENGKLYLTGDSATARFDVSGADIGLEVIEGIATVNNVSSTNGHGVSARGAVKLEINGNVTGGKGGGIYAIAESDVTVTGNVTSNGYSIYASYSRVTVNGNVTSSTAGSYGVYAENSSVVAVNGNVSASGDGSRGAKALENGRIHITGTLSSTGANTRDMEIGETFYNVGTPTNTRVSLPAPFNGYAWDEYRAGNAFVFLRKESMTGVPTISTSPVDYATTPGGTARFAVVAAGTGTLTYKWQVHAGGSGGWSDVSDSDIISGADKATIQLSNVPETFDKYNFRCLVTDSTGNTATSTSATLFVNSKGTIENGGGLTPTPTPTPIPDTADMKNFVKVNTYTPGQFTDVSESAWYGFNQQKVIAGAYEFGLMQGNSATIFGPLENYTIAQALAVASRINSIYMTGKADFTQGSPWYQVYVDYTLANGIIEASDFSDYGRPATRAEMAYILSRSLPQAEFAEKNSVISLPDVTGATPFSESIITLYKAGVLGGSDDKGTFHPGNNISRAEAAAIISRIVVPESRFSGKVYQD